MAHLINNMNVDILKVPLGFIRVLEFPLVIIAFASTVDYKVSDSYEAKTCGGNPVAFNFAYPFKLTELKIPTNSCTTGSGTVASSTAQIFHENYTSQAQFFVFTGVMSFLFIIGILVVYLFKWENYEMDKRLPMIDFLVTGTLTLFWFAGTIAWAAALTGIKIATNQEVLETKNLAKVDVACAPKSDGVITCKMAHGWGYSGLYISVIAGFGCIFVFCGNLWFIWKETEWFKNRQGPPPVGDYPGGPPAGTPSDKPYP